MDQIDAKDRRPFASRTREDRDRPVRRRPRLEGLEDRVLMAANPIVVENQRPGSPPSQWQVSGAGDSTIQGFATDISVDDGQTVYFSINDPSGAAYHVDIFRMGYYQGNGARLVTTIPSSATLRRSQPAPLVNYATGLVDAGNWSISASWNVPEGATSGIYFANARREDTGGVSQIFFVVRDDEGSSDLFFQTSDSTWQAYNPWDGITPTGNTSLYSYNGDNPELQARGKALAVSYNRPLTVSASGGGLGDYNSPFHAEYPMVRWLESNGYDVSYTTDVDSARRGDLIRNHKAFLSVGHDEYWSKEQRDNVEAARDAGVNLAFFSGNEIFWKTRWEPSIAGPASPYRTIVTYKESQVGRPIDPLNQAPTYVSTGTWRDDRLGPLSDGGRPENSLSGTIYMNDRTSVDLGISMNVPASDANLRFWRDTSVEGLQAGQVATLGQYVVGYETDEDLDNGHRPAGLVTMSSTTFATTSHIIVPWGTEVGPGVSTHKITLYRASSGALVFGAGTVQWSWGLDGNHGTTPSTPEPAIQQATVNLFADMNVQPATLRPGLVRADASTDVTAPTSTITGPAGGSSFAVGSPITVTGTATDSGGGVVGGVEVSTDGGKTWHPAVGRASWSYTWTADRPGPILLQTRAVDDSANLGAPSTGVTIAGFHQPTSTTGLVAAYDFDEGSGTTVNDRSGRGNGGTTSNATWAPGVFGQALSFNGSSSWVTVNDSNSLDLTGGMTIEAWVKPTATASDAASILTKEQPNGLAYALYSADGAGQPPSTYIRDANGDQATSGRSGLPLNTWSFLAATYDGSSLLLYVNGTLAGAQRLSGPILTSTGALRIGGNSTFGDYFRGLIDQVRIYNRPLNPAEIQSDMNARLGGPSDSTPPTGAIGGPAGGANVSGVATLTANVSDNLLVAGVQFLLNGSNLGNAITSAPYALAWETRTKPNGPYTISALVRDSAGNVTRLADRAVTVSNPPDTTPPVLALRNPTGGLARGTIIPSAYASDAIGIVGVRFRLNGTDLGPPDTTAPYRIAWDTSTVADGTYILTAVAEDSAGNVTTTSPVSITVDNTRPSATGLMPASGSTGVSTSIPLISAAFGEPLLPGTLRFLLESAGAFLASGQVTYDPLTGVAGFAPDGSLEPSMTYTATVTGALDLAGNPMNPASWTFTTTSTVVNATLWKPTTIPAIASASDSSPNELGVKFKSDVAGFITGIRFYKGPANVGTHVGHLWDASGRLLASVTFANETGSGWRQANFGQPVEIAAGATYVASYFAPNGGYAFNGGYFATSGTDAGVLHAPPSTVAGGNGVYRGGSGFPSSSYNASNYWVDVVFSNVLGPSVVATTPVANASGVPAAAPGIAASFSKPVEPATILFTLRDPAGNLVPAVVGYDPSTGMAILTPLAPLAALTTYTAAVDGARDANGIAMIGPFTWSFTTAPVDTTSPSVTSRTPTPGADFISNAAPALSVLAVFSEDVRAGSIVFTLKDPSGNPVPTTVTYDTASRTVGLIPNSALTFSATYTATLSGAMDLSGNLMAPTSWSFTTNPVANATLFGVAATPAVASANDSTPLELGVKFSSDVGGYVTGVRFYKGPLNLGTHVAHVWAANDTLQFGPCPGCACGAVCFLRIAGGTLLASATFTNETASGWQEVRFARPVFIVPKATYVVSYTAPNGGYAYTGGYFANSGVDAGVLHAPASGPAGGNGVYGAPNALPTATFNANNYWIDAVFSNSMDDLTPPTIVAMTPGSGATDVAPTTSVGATFSEPVDPDSVTFSIADSAGRPVAVSARWDPAPGGEPGKTLVLTPLEALASLATYTVSIGGATDPSGNPMAAPATWSFKTAFVGAFTDVTIWPTGATPAVLSAEDRSAVVLGVKFQSDISGDITGVRFYKGPGNTGTHVGRLWTASGTLLASATFTDETGSGWQQVDFASPVPIVANTTYVAGYDAPDGGYSYTGAYFATSGMDSAPLRALPSGPSGGNGVYAYGSNLFPTSSYNANNYWVDVVFSQSSSRASSTTSATPYSPDMANFTTFTPAAAGRSIRAADSDDTAFLAGDSTAPIQPIDGPPGLVIGATRDTSIATPLALRSNIVGPAGFRQVPALRSIVAILEVPGTVVEEGPVEVDRTPPTSTRIFDAALEQVDAGGAEPILNLFISDESSTRPSHPRRPFKSAGSVAPS